MMCRVNSSHAEPRFIFPYDYFHFSGLFGDNLQFSVLIKLTDAREGGRRTEHNCAAFITSFTNQACAQLFVTVKRC